MRRFVELCGPYFYLSFSQFLDSSVTLEVYVGGRNKCMVTWVIIVFFLGGSIPFYWMSLSSRWLGRDCSSSVLSVSVSMAEGTGELRSTRWGAEWTSWSRHQADWTTSRWTSSSICAPSPTWFGFYLWHSSVLGCWHAIGYMFIFQCFVGVQIRGLCGHWLFYDSYDVLIFCQALCDCLWKAIYK